VLEHQFLEEQVTSIREFAGHVTRLRSFKTSNYALGEYMYDKELQ
jgi:ferritin